MSLHTLEGGFATPAHDAAFAFRALMDAMARPGTLEEIAGGKGPAPLSQAASCVLLTLCDADTNFYLTPSVDTGATRAWIAFHTGAPITGAETADFALGPWAELRPLDRFRIGTPEYPDQSATLIVEMESLTQTGATLSGPGIQTTAHLSLPDVDAIRRNAKAFPLGLDFIFTAGSTVAALPRSTEVR